MGFLGLLGILFFAHHLQNRPDHHVQEYKSRQEDKRQVVDPAQGIGFHSGVHHVGPVLEGGNPEQSEHGDGHIAPEYFVHAGKEHRAHGGIDVKDDEHQQGDVAHARNGFEQGIDQEAQFWHYRHQSQHPEYPQQPAQQHRLGVVQRDQAADHYQGVEQVPAVHQEPALDRAGGEAKQDFHQEEQRDGVVQNGQGLFNQRREFVGFCADGQGRENDDGNHNALKHLARFNALQLIKTTCGSYVHRHRSGSGLGWRGNSNHPEQRVVAL